MNGLIILLMVAFCFFMGAWTHENDMARNCAVDGNAHAWFNEIECAANK